MDKNRVKKWPLLVRSLSDSAKLHKIKNARIKTETKALTLSLSDSRLFSSKKSVTSARSLSSDLLDILNDKETETCSCGCDQDIEEEEDYSEDEGCFVITSVPASNEEQEEVTNKVRAAKMPSYQGYLIIPYACLVLPAKKSFLHTIYSHEI